MVHSKYIDSNRKNFGVKSCRDAAGPEATERR